ncbi:glycosyltransferase family 2 protein [Anaeromicropila populeti]|uniref:Dolichol-phosphate mannosyltransferase n=1 Tax=Anaeromicropila populeti TaxID=37658 RepID=A0A1I6KIV3_9FIRM|nr:glycosyltransferase family 2 protein [Anaeromicropila populeti]SFR91169.1 dolichol-phosphate mannosyltransferase [Anaeromicropila populeti]
MVRYSIIIPAYNEEEVLDETYKRLTEVMKSTEEEYELIFINDGSRDNTFKMLQDYCKKDSSIKVVNFSRNFGHQIAVTAGMEYSSGQAVVIIDADLQDPPRVILEMIAKWKEGYDVVYGKRLVRKGETFFKKFTAKCFYRILDHMTTVDIPVDTGDFRLMDRKVVDVMNSLSEKNRYVRGLVSWVGFKQTAVEYMRDGRFAGETKYPLKKMLKLAADGILSFSYKPLHFAGVVGSMLSFASFIYLIIVVIQKLFTSTTQPGWASLVAVILFFNGVSLILHCITGEYVGRIYEETKNRPLYIVREAINFDESVVADIRRK